MLLWVAAVVVVVVHNDFDVHDHAVAVVAVVGKRWRKQYCRLKSWMLWV